MAHYEQPHQDLHCLQIQLFSCLVLKELSPIDKIAEFANSVDQDDVDHHEPPQFDQHCLPSSLCFLSMKLDEIEILQT